MARTKEELAEYQRNYRAIRKAAGIPLRDSSTYEENQASRLRKYGLTEETYLAMYRKQDGKCAICATAIRERNERGRRRDNTHIDHCHTSGKVRGLLCGGCNLGLGHFLDNYEALLAAAAYLKSQQ